MEDFNMYFILFGWIFGTIVINCIAASRPPIQLAKPENLKDLKDPIYRVRESYDDGYRSYYIGKYELQWKCVGHHNIGTPLPYINFFLIPFSTLFESYGYVLVNEEHVRSNYDILAINSLEETYNHLYDTNVKRLKNQKVEELNKEFKTNFNKL